jgi:hypothetical protein
MQFTKLANLDQADAYAGKHPEIVNPDKPVATHALAQPADQRAVRSHRKALLSRDATGLVFP